MRHRIDLSSARNGEYLNLQGRRFEIVAASDAAANADFRVVYSDGQTREYLNHKLEEFTQSSKPFTDVQVRNTAQAGAWLDIELTNFDDEFIYKRRTDLNIASILAAILTRGGNTIEADTVTVDNTETLILAANADRTGWSIQNPSATLPLLIGPSGSVLYSIPAGGEKSGTGTYALYGKYASGSEDVPYMEESEV